MRGKAIRIENLKSKEFLSGAINKGHYTVAIQKFLGLIIFKFVIFTASVGNALDVPFDLQLGKPQFYGIYINKIKVGYASFKTELIDYEDEEALELKTYFELEFPADPGFKEKIIWDEVQVFGGDDEKFLVLEKSSEKSFQQSIEREDAPELNVETSQLEAKLIKKNIYEIRERSGGEVVIKEFALPAQRLQDFFSLEILAASNPVLGQTEEIYVDYLDFQEKSFSSAINKVEQVLSDSRTGAKTIIIRSLPVNEPTEDPVYTVLNESGEVLEFNLYGFTAKLESEASAKDVSSPAELFLIGDIPIDEPIKNPENLSELTLELRGYQLFSNVIDTRRQAILSKDDQLNSTVIKLTAAHGPIQSSNVDLPEKFTGSDTKHDLELEELLVLNSVIREDMSEFSDEDKIRYLIDFTFDYIEYEITSVASLKDIIVSRRGDCTEYATLFIALSRLNGIPARQASGYVYNYDDDYPAFSRHAWAEVWLDDAWKEVDPSWQEFDLNITHVSLKDDAETNFLEEISVVSYEN